MRLALDAILLPRVMPCVPVFLSLAGRPGSNGCARRRKIGESNSFRSSPRKQGPSSRPWIPAFAGMSGVLPRDRYCYGPLIKPRIDLVVVLFHELDVARKLNGLRRLERLVELFQHLLLVLRWNCLVGCDV